MNSVELSRQSSLAYQPPNASEPQQTQDPLLPHFKKAVQTNTQDHKMRWNERAIYKLNQWETKLEKAMPNFKIQRRIDSIGQYIEKKFAPLKEFNRWLDSNGHGAWYHQLATFLAKLPARAIRNIVRLVYQIIKSIFYAGVHPLKSLTRLAKLIVSLIDALTKPETYSKIGAGMIGASLGQAAVMGNFISLMGLGIGGAMLAAGLSMGALKAAVEAQKGVKIKAVKEHLLMQAKQLPESLLTGFFMGLLFGGIQRAVAPSQYRITTVEDAKAYAKQFIKENNLPDPLKIVLDPDKGEVSIYWNSIKGLPNVDGHSIGNIRIELGPSYAKAHSVLVWDGFEGDRTIITYSLDKVGLAAPAYPYPPAPSTVIQTSPAVAVSETFRAAINPQNQ